MLKITTYAALCLCAIARITLSIATFPFHSNWFASSEPNQSAVLVETSHAKKPLFERRAISIGNHANEIADATYTVVNATSVPGTFVSNHGSIETFTGAGVFNPGRMKSFRIY